jgi:hypothetical protein
VPKWHRVPGFAKPEAGAIAQELIIRDTAGQLGKDRIYTRRVRDPNRREDQTPIAVSDPIEPARRGGVLSLGRPVYIFPVRTGDLRD